MQRRGNYHPDCHKTAAQHVMDYAISKQLRGGWGVISECMTVTDIAGEFLVRDIRTKTDGLVWARGIVKLQNEAERNARA